MGVERRRAAVPAANVVGYSRLMGTDELGTLRTLNEHRLELILGATPRLFLKQLEQSGFPTIALVAAGAVRPRLP